MAPAPFNEEQQVAVAKVIARVMIDCGHFRHANGNAESPWAIGPSLLVAKAVLSMGHLPEGDGPAAALPRLSAETSAVVSELRAAKSHRGAEDAR